MPSGRTVELRQITKRYGEIVANDAIDLTLRAGQIHGLVGENGAGKTTLMNVLFGLVRPDSGQILLDGRPMAWRGPADALAAGIGMVHQHYMLVEPFTVAENIALGREPGAGPWLDLPAARRRVSELADRFGLDLDPDAVVADLPVGVRQRVEIVRALANDASLLVLDEPTAVLRPQEVDLLFGVLRRLRDDGRAVVLITHKLAEVTAVADVVTVLRAGRVVDQLPPDTPHAELAALMVGRQVPIARPRPGTSGAVRLTLRGVPIRGGELVGIAGVQGNGQDALVAELRAAEPGLAFIPEDRMSQGLVAGLPISDNLLLDRLAEVTNGWGLLRPERMRELATSAADEFGIRGSLRRPAAHLSGGNQQRVVLARELSRPTPVVLACEPTRGLDVAAVAFVHDRLLAARDAGAAVVVVSSDLDELTGLADRLLVVHGGRIVADVAPGVDRAELGMLMAGVRHAP